MSYVQVGTENGADINIYYEDHGQGQPVVLIGVIAPFLLKTDDNPEGVDGQVFAGIKAAIVADRYAYFADFLNNF